MTGDDMKYLRDEFWRGAFTESRRLGLDRDGEYHVQVDRDSVLMYCMG